MALITRPYSYSPNTLIESTKNNSNESTIYGEFNGSISDANVSSLTESKITFSATGHAHSGGTGGAPVQWVVGTDITSAGSITIPTDGNYFTVTGATGPITALGTRNAGVIARLRFASTPTLTHNATSLILATAADHVCVAGDILEFMSLGSGNWREIGDATAMWAHRRASAAVHGLTASVNVLGNRTAAAQFIQHAAGTAGGGNTDSGNLFTSGGNAVSFAVAFGAAPRVFVGSVSVTNAAGNAISITTSGFSLVVIGETGVTSATASYLALGGA